MYRFAGVLMVVGLLPSVALAQAETSNADESAGAGEDAGPLPPLPKTPPMYEPCPCEGSRSSGAAQPQSEWAAQLRVESVGFGSEAAPDAKMGGLGVSLRPRPTPHFALDLGLDVFGGHDFNAERRKEMSFTVNPMFFLNPRQVVQVYLLTGLGFAGATVEHADQTTSHYRYVGVDAGVGLEIRFARKVALDIDLVGFLRTRTDRAARESPEFVDPETGQTSNTSGGGLARLGLAYYW
jgi:hypothetical protein